MLILSACQSAAPPALSAAQLSEARALWQDLQGSSWRGTYENGLPVSLAVDAVGETGVEATYAWGERFVGVRLYRSGSRTISGVYTDEPERLFFAWRVPPGNLRQLDARYDGESQALHLHLVGPKGQTRGILNRVARR